MLRAGMGWVYVFVMIGIVIIVWAVSQPIVHVLISEGTDFLNASTVVTEEQYVDKFNMLETLNLLWAPLTIFCLLIYGFLASSQEEGIGSYAPSI